MSASRRLASLAAAVSLVLTPSAAFAAAPTNDDRTGPTEVTELPFTTTQDTSEATGHASDPRGCYSRPDRTVWYRYTAAESGRLVASTAGSTYGTQVEVLERSGPSLTSIACDQDTHPNTPGVAVGFPVTAGRTYLFAVGQPEYSNQPKSWDLTFSLRSQPVVEVTLDRGAFITKRTGAVTLTGTATCSENVSVSISPTLRQGTRNAAFGYVQSYLDCTPTPQLFNLSVPQTSSRTFAAGAANLTASIDVPGEAYNQQVEQAASLTMCTLVGTVADDTLSGTADADRICGLHGDDVIRSGGGNDVVFGGAGRDEIRLGGGNDWAGGGDGADVIVGQGGNDTLLGGDGRDRLVGGKGYDRCTGGKSRDRFRGCEVRTQ